MIRKEILVNNVYKKLVAGISVSALLFSFAVGTVAANTVTPTVSKKQEREAKVQEKKAEREEKKAGSIERLKAKALKEIERRIKALTHLLELIADADKLSASQKSTLTTQVQAEIASLTALKAKIIADTDVATLRTDVQSIKNSYRIFALFIPKIHILIKAGRTLELADKTSSLAAKLEQRIASLPEGSSESAALQTQLNTMKKQISDAKGQVGLAINTVTLLTPEGYPANKTGLMAARKLLKDAHKNLMDAHKTGKQIIKALRKNDVTAAPIATVVPTVAVTTAPTVVPTQ